MPRRKGFKGDTMARDRYGRIRWRLRTGVDGRRIDKYLPGPFGSTDFIAAYEAALEGGRGR